MPEGDTVHKIAARLRARVEGRPLDALWLRDRGEVAPLAGASVVEVSAIGKHLLVVLDAPRARPRQWTLHVHLGMHGRWFVASAEGGHADREAPGVSRALTRPPRRAASAGLVSSGEAWTVVRAARAELLRPAELSAHPVLRALGPDLLDPRCDLDAVVARAARREPGSVSDLLLDQRVACGLGNVYRNEILFLEGLPPEWPANRLSPEAIRSLYARGRDLLAANLGGWRRTTTRSVSRERPLHRGEPRAWVYARGGQPCLRCRTTIRGRRLGDQARATWWCPRCQSVPRSGRACREAAGT